MLSVASSGSCSEVVQSGLLVKSFPVVRVGTDAFTLVNGSDSGAALVRESRSWRSVRV